MAKAGPLKDPMSKTQVVTEIAAKTGLSRKQVSTSLDELSEIISRHIKKTGPGKFAMPGLFKITTVRKPATKARKGINPFTKEEVMFKAKPARTVIKIRPLKKLKDMV
jgi:nucleoid DNA-binding protein